MSYDVYVADMDQSIDNTGQIRMRLVTPCTDFDEADEAGVRACVDMLDEAGLFNIARSHVISSPCYPNSTALAQFALKLIDSTDPRLGKFWIHDLATGEMRENRVSDYGVAKVLRAGTRTNHAEIEANVIADLAAAIRRGGSDSDVPSQALRLLSGVMATPRWEESGLRVAHTLDGVVFSWTHRFGRAAGRYSIQLQCRKVIVRRTRHASSTTETATVEGISKTNVDLMGPALLRVFRDGLMPAENDPERAAVG